MLSGWTGGDETMQDCGGGGTSIGIIISPEFVFHIEMHWRSQLATLAVWGFPCQHPRHLGMDFQPDQQHSPRTMRFSAGSYSENSNSKKILYSLVST